MTKILITGANSFIGKNFRRFTRYPDTTEVSLFDTKPENIEFSNVNVVLHLAAIVHQSRKYSNSDYFAVNRDLTVNVAAKAKSSGVKQFIFLSSVKVYGACIPSGIIWNEESQCCPEDAYGMSKYQAEQGLKQLEGPDFIVSIVRTPIVYGPDVSANILKLIKLIERYPVLPFGKVDNNRHFTYVENLVGFIDRIIEIHMPGTFIAMDNEALSTTILVNTISASLGRKPALFRLPGVIKNIGIHLMPSVFDRLYNSFYLNNSKTRKLLNFSPAISSTEGVRRTINSYLKSKNNARK